MTSTVCGMVCFMHGLCYILHHLAINSAETFILKYKICLLINLPDPEQKTVYLQDDDLVRLSPKINSQVLLFFVCVWWGGER